MSVSKIGLGAKVPEKLAPIQSSGTDIALLI